MFVRERGELTRLGKLQFPAVCIKKIKSFDESIGISQTLMHI